LSSSSSSSTRQTLRETRRTREAKKTRGRESKKEAGDQQPRAFAFASSRPGKRLLLLHFVAAN